MTAITWLHLTDLHLGMNGTKELWPNVEEAFLGDLAYLVGRVGGLDLVLFTGDLVQRGAAEEFEQVNRVLAKLWQRFAEMGVSPQFLALPGNHDLVRPPDKGNPALLNLRHLWDLPDVQEAFWKNPDSPQRAIVKAAFANYEAWWKALTIPRPADVRPGILPGEFSVTIAKDDVTLGILGLNSTFLQLTGAEKEGDLAVNVLQFHGACDGHGPDWALRHDACLLLTHHPVDWLKKQSGEEFNGEIYHPPRRFAAHLFGHMHESNLTSLGLGGGEVRRSLQGTSLFGLEGWGEKPVERIHGYSIGQIRFMAKGARLRIWPRRAVKNQQGGWKITLDTTFSLPTGKEATVPMPIPLLKPRPKIVAPPPDTGQMDAPPPLTQSDHAKPTGSTPPAEPKSTVPLNLPLVARNPFFGRETERDKIIAAVRNRELVLVYGMGGIGKTSLAVAVVRQLSTDPEFKGAILWLDATGIDSVEALCDAIVRQIGDDQMLQLTGDQKAAATKALLGRMVRLVVLDDPSTLTAQLFLRQCLPLGTALLCTDRERRIANNVNADVRLHPLDREAAVALFRERTGESVKESDEEVGAVCATLGNHPLALATAAGHVRRTDIPLDRLQTQLQQAHDPEVTASLSLSFADLPDIERLAITRLAAFFDTTTGVILLALACELSEQECEEAVGGLVERSLVERAGDRLGLHLLVRDHVRDVVIGAEQLEVVRLEILRMLEDYFFASLDETPEAEARLEAEIGNLRGAVEYAGAKGFWDIALLLADRLISDLSILELRGYWSEQVAIGRVGITAAQEEGDEDAKARLLHHTGIALQYRGEVEEAAQLYDESLTIERQLGDQAGIARSLHQLGMLAQARGEVEEAARLYDESLTISRQEGIHAGIAITKWALGDLSAKQGETEAAEQLYNESLTIYERLGSPNAAIMRHKLELLPARRNTSPASDTTDSEPNEPEGWHRGWRFHRVG